MSTKELIHQEIENARDEDLDALYKLVRQFNQSQRISNGLARPRAGGLHRGAMRASEDFDAPLPDSFWLGTE